MALLLQNLRLLRVVVGKLAHPNCVTTAIKPQQRLAGLQDGCPHYRTQVQIKTGCSNNHNNLSITHLWSSITQTKTVNLSARANQQRTLQSLGVLDMTCASTHKTNLIVSSACAVDSRQFYTRAPLLAGLSVRPFHTGACLLAGHSKWANIKHVKGAKDQAKSILNAKYAKLVRLAVKENGPNPSTNSQLSNLIDIASSKDVPKATIDNAIKTALQKKSGPEIEQLYELKGPDGCVLLVDVLTDNTNRTRQQINRMLKTSVASLCDSGSTMYAFERKGVVRVRLDSVGDQQPLTLDLATEVAIEVDAEDVQEVINEENETVFMFVCHPSNVKNVRKGLQSYNVESSGLEYLPVQDFLVELNDASLEKVSQTIQMLEENPDVVKVYDNIMSPDSN